MVSVSTRRSVRFNLGSFIEDLVSCFDNENYEDIDDVVQEFKDFLTRVDDKLLIEIKAYTEAHPMLVKSPKIKSFVDSCYKNLNI